MKGWAMNISIFCGPKWQLGLSPSLPFHRATKNLNIHGPPLHIALVMFTALIKTLLARRIRNTALLIVIITRYLPTVLAVLQVLTIHQAIELENNSEDSDSSWPEYPYWTVLSSGTVPSSKPFFMLRIRQILFFIFIYLVPQFNLTK